MDYKAWISRSDAELAGTDLAEINLLSAEGLPGAEWLDISDCLTRLDDWAETVRHGTKRAMRHRPDHGDCTNAQFLILAMVTVLQRDLGVHYNPECMVGSYDATDSRNHFIHGPLFGHGGTCSSLPVLYAAIGRRLNYPLSVVRAKDHLFVRWDDQSAGERFNFEAAARGFRPTTDEHYHQWPLPLTPRDISSGSYLTNLSPRQELAMCLHQRALCFQDHLRMTDALQAMKHAAALDSPYVGDLRVLTMMDRILRGLEYMSDDATPDAEEIRWCTPPPMRQWEEWASPIAQDELSRIFALAAKARDVSVGTVFSIQAAKI